MEKRIVIKYDVVTGEIFVENPDDITDLEFLGLVEMAKQMVMDNESS